MEELVEVAEAVDEDADEDEDEVCVEVGGSD